MWFAFTCLSVVYLLFLNQYLVKRPCTLTEQHLDPPAPRIMDNRATASLWDRTETETKLES